MQAVPVNPMNGNSNVIDGTVATGGATAPTSAPPADSFTIITAATAAV